MSKCKFCGAEVIGEHRFCPQCGKALDGGKEDTPATQAATTPQKKKGKKLVIGSIIGACLVLAIAFCTVFIMTELKKEHMQKELLLGLQYYLGQDYLGQDVEQDYAKAVEHLQKAADLGDADAHYYLGECYYNGQGVAQDYTKAYEYYRKAVEYYQKDADQGDAHAQFRLGDCYYTGQGIEYDYAKAVEYFQKAADQGDATAQNSLGFCYEHGHGVEKDLTKAAEYYQKAADQGHAVAKENLEALEQLGIK